MKKAVTAQEMKEIEKKAAENGLSYLQMMENAGQAAVDELLRTYSLTGKIVLIAVGKGNNGGDGLVAARLLHQIGIPVVVILTEGLPVTEDATTNFKRCQELGIEILRYESQVSDLLFAGADFILDAVYGAGFHGDFREPAASAVRAINQSDAKVIALDLPSGLNADTGEAAPHTVQAELTITFARLKLGQIGSNGLRFCGKIILADIGI